MAKENFGKIIFCNFIITKFLISPGSRNTGLVSNGLKLDTPGAAYPAGSTSHGSHAQGYERRPRPML